MKKSGVITAGSLFIPSFLRAGMFSDELLIQNKRLVVIQLSGGNDGINTIIPYGLDEYYQNRSRVGIKADEILKIDEKFGFHPKMEGFRELYGRGMVSIINAVGYPNPNRSHFKSMDIWHSAANTTENWSTGWLGRYMDSNCQHAYQGIEYEGSLSMAMKGKELSGIALTNPQAFHDTIHSDFYDRLKTPETTNSELDFLYKIFNDTRSSAVYIYDQYKLKTNPTVYPFDEFSRKLKDIATLIRSGIQTPVFYTSMGGFDTHVGQPISHARLLEQLDRGVTTFVKDLESENLMKDTTILIFSEFGRRLKDNASRGTDHGKAGVTFVIDSNLNSEAHTYNSINLTDLDDGDPQFNIDFRRIYAEILGKILKADADHVLNRHFDPLKLF